MAIFFGKISKEMGEQLTMDFYAAGEKGSPWYNGLEIGDYVFPIYDGIINKLWKVKGYYNTPETKKIFDKNSVHFEVVKIFDKPIPLAVQFCRYRYFDLNLTLLNKSAKSTSSEQKGFFEITTLDNCPKPEEIDLSDIRNILISLEGVKYTYSNNDVRIKVEKDNEEYKLIDIEIYKSNEFQHYQSLWNLYDKKNIEKYSLNQLLKFSETDEAPKKEKYLNGVIADLDDQGYFIVSQPIALYDNVLVGRKKTSRKKNKSERPELIDPIDDIDESIDEQKFEKYADYVDLLAFNPNIILYGPPGTGKTYTAQRIIEANEYKLTNDPTVEFNNIKEDGRVEFITFHQSYSYEEFVEGIRPVISKDEETENEINGIKYEVKPGILRNIANNASLNVLKENKIGSTLEGLHKGSKIYKVSLGQRGSEEYIYKQCKQDNIIAIGWLEDLDLSGKDYNYFLEELKKSIPENSPEPTNDTSTINLFVNDLQKGDIIFIYDGPFTIRDIGIVVGDYFYDNKRKSYRHVRAVRWIKEFKDGPFDISSYNSNVRLTMKTIYPLSRITFDDLVSIIGEEQFASDNSKKAKPFYIIIDEINRGNISKIFGELITLIEKDKRDNLKLTLPYSQKPFSLPSNLYFIGTMNTADRSIAILDTALRRRFVFKELEPNPEIIQEGENPQIDNKVDLSVLLAALNVKIEQLYDRDHRIGHSYFLNAINIKSLKQVWYYQIIPLLLEYFYNDGEKVSKVIGEKFIQKKTGTVNYNLSNEEFTNELLSLCK